jgi:hypothetical protein
MPFGRKDTLLEIDGIRAVEQHVLIVVSLYDKVVSITDSLLNVGIRFAAIGNQHETLAVSTNLVTEAIGGVVVDTERGDLHIVENECLPFLEVSP